jgi:hypothetical protein
MAIPPVMSRLTREEKNELEWILNRCTYDNKTNRTKTAEAFKATETGICYDFVNYLYFKLKRLHPKCFFTAFVHTKTRELFITHSYIVFPQYAVLETSITNPRYRGEKQFNSWTDIFTWYLGAFYNIGEYNDNRIKDGYYFGTIEYIPENVSCTIGEFCEKVLREGKQVQSNRDPFPTIRKFVPPLTFDQLLEKGYRQEIVDNLRRDPAHKWIHENQLELVHKENTLNDQRNNFINWCCMNDDQKDKSDKQSKMLFQRDNIDHFYNLVSKSYATYETVKVPEHGNDVTYEMAAVCDLREGFGIAIVIHTEDHGYIDKFRTNSQLPAHAHVFKDNMSTEVGEINITTDCPKSVTDVTEYLPRKNDTPKLSSDVKKAIVKWANKPFEFRGEIRNKWYLAQITWETYHIGLM